MSRERKCYKLRGEKSREIKRRVRGLSRREEKINKGRRVGLWER